MAELGLQLQLVEGSETGAGVGAGGGAVDGATLPHRTLLARPACQGVPPRSALLQLEWRGGGGGGAGRSAGRAGGRGRAAGRGRGHTVVIRAPILRLNLDIHIWS